MPESYRIEFQIESILVATKNPPDTIFRESDQILVNAGDWVAVLHDAAIFRAMRERADELLRENFAAWHQQP
jgi:hypothetical protein